MHGMYLIKIIFALYVHVIFGTIGVFGLFCTQGDGGGPLTCYNEKTQSEVQIGITSWGIDCGKIGVPGVYTDVMVHRDWITSTVDYLLNGYRQ